MPGSRPGWRTRPCFLVLLGAYLLVGCVPRIAPAPVVYKGSPMPDTVTRSEQPRGLAVPRLPAPGPGGGHEVVVAQGDTLYGIAKRSGTPLRTVIEANGLRPPYTLRVGQRIIVPAARAHVVLRGETVYGIARRYGVGTSALVRANGIRPPYTIRPGERLVLPAAVEPTTAASEAASDSREGSAPTSRLARSGVVPMPPPRSGRPFLWPVKGRVISTFGAQSGGFHNDGINIAAPTGTPVLAAENGVVVYAGGEMKGFGNLVLVRHADGWMTAYAHNDVLLVARGDTVKRGQTIARTGSTGRVPTPQLHFEIRKGVKAVDPRDHLAGGNETGRARKEEVSRAFSPSALRGPG